MITTTTRRGSDMPTTLAQKLNGQLDEIHAANVATWRAMAKSLAEGNAPRPRDLLEVAAALEIDNPGPALEADAAAMHDRLRCDAAIQLCRDKVVEQLKPFGGRVETLRAAAEKADVEAKRLRELLDDATACHESFWFGRASQVERENFRVFGEWRLRPKFQEQEAV
jgi:hypothetical protein